MPHKLILIVSFCAFIFTSAWIGCVSKDLRPVPIDIATTEPAPMRIYCNPGLISCKLPALSDAFDALPPGRSIRAVLYGPFPSETNLDFTICTRLDILQGSVILKCMNGDVTYTSGGNIFLDWKIKRAKVLEMSRITAISISLLKEKACVDFGWLILPDGRDFPNNDRNPPFLLLPNRSVAEGEFILELHKSIDFQAGPSKFSVVRSL